MIGRAEVGEARVVTIGVNSRSVGLAELEDISERLDASLAIERTLRGPLGWDEGEIFTWEWKSIFDIPHVTQRPVRPSGGLWHANLRDDATFFFHRFYATTRRRLRLESSHRDTGWCWFR